MNFTQSELYYSRNYHILTHFFSNFTIFSLPSYVTYYFILWCGEQITDLSGEPVETISEKCGEILRSRRQKECSRCVGANRTHVNAPAIKPCLAWTPCRFVAFVLSPCLSTNMKVLAEAPRWFISAASKQPLAFFVRIRTYLHTYLWWSAVNCLSSSSSSCSSW